MVTRAAPRRHRSRPVGEVKPTEDGPLAAPSGLPLFPNPSAVVDADAPARRSPSSASRGPLAGGPEPGARAPAGAPAVGHEPGATSAASLSSRLVAGSIDLALLLVLDALVVGLTLRLAGLTMASFGVLPAAPLAAFLLLLDGGYLVVLTAIGGQTFGKMVAGIRVVDLGGHPVRGAAALMRATAMIVSLLPAGAGLVWMCTVRNRRGLHDRVAGTSVVVVPRPV